MKNIIDKLGITPAPWYRTFWNNIDGLWEGDERSDIQHGDSENICDCIYSEADGKLFFYAPEMLEALIEEIIDAEKIIKENPDLVFDLTSQNKRIKIIEKVTGLEWEKVKELLK